MAIVAPTFCASSHTLAKASPILDMSHWSVHISPAHLMSRARSACAASSRSFRIRSDVSRFAPGFEPVSEKLDLDVNNPVIVEQSFHRRVAHRFGVENEILMNESKPRISGRRCGLDAFLQREGRLTSDGPIA